MSQILVITSGKGGVGKTTTTANIGVGLAMRGNKVALIDTDTGLRNLDLLLGLENRILYDLVDVTSGRVQYKKALVRHKKYENLYLLPTSQIKDKSAVNPEQLIKLCDEMKNEFDFIIIVTMPEISAVRDADKIIGELGRADKDNVKLIVNRIRPQMIEKGDMLDMGDIDEILSVTCIGQVPDDESVVVATNRGEPVITMNDSVAGKAYKNIVARICGEDVPFLKPQKEGFFARLKKLFGLM